MSAAIPQGWQKCRLEDCVEVLDSLRVPVNNAERQARIEGKPAEQLYPYYGATGQVGVIDDFLFDEELVALGEDGVPFLDPFKPKAYMLRGKTWVNNHAHVLRGLDGVVLNKFIFYYLNQFDYQGCVNGGTRLKLTQASMRTIPVPLPSFAEQTRIAAKLDELLAQVDTLKARIDGIPALLKRFRQSVLAAAVSGRLTEGGEGSELPAGWQEKPFSSVISDLRYGTAQKCDYGGGSIGVLRIPNVGENGISLEDLKSSNFSEAEIRKLSLQQGDIVLIRSNGSVELVGKSAVVSRKEEGLLFAGYLIRVRLDNKKALPKYVNFWLKSPAVRQVIELTARSTSGVNNINSEEIKSLMFTMPSLATQTEIVRRVEQLFAFADQLEAKVNEAKKRIDRLTQSILAKAFRGELVPQDPSDEPASELLARIQAQRASAPKTRRGRKVSV